MNKIKIGNDISVTWKIDLSSAKGSNTLVQSKTELFLVNAYETKSITNYVINDNVVSFIYKGNVQKYTGTYDLVLKDTDEGTRMICARNAFALVLHTVEERGAINAKDSSGNYVVELADNAVTIKDINEDAGMYVRVSALEESLAATSMKTVNITELDALNSTDLCNDGRPAVYTVLDTSGKMKVGVLYLYSDSDGHSVTQVLATNYVPNNNFSGHDDAKVHQYYRIYNNSSSHGLSDTGTWSDWMPYIDDTVKTVLTKCGENITKLTNAVNEISALEESLVDEIWENN